MWERLNLKETLRGRVNNPSLEVCAASLACPACQLCHLLSFCASEIVRFNVVCQVLSFQMNEGGNLLFAATPAFACLALRVACLVSLPSCLLLYLHSGRPAAETPPPTLRFLLPDILTGHSLAATLATLAHLRGNYTGAAVCCVNRSRRRFSRGADCVVLGFSSHLSGAGRRRYLLTCPTLSHWPVR